MTNNVYSKKIILLGVLATICTPPNLNADPGQSIKQSKLNSEYISGTDSGIEFAWQKGEIINLRMSGEPHHKNNILNINSDDPTADYALGLSHDGKYALYWECNDFAGCGVELWNIDRTVGKLERVGDDRYTAGMPLIIAIRDDKNKIETKWCNRGSENDKNLDCMSLDGSAMYHAADSPDGYMLSINDKTGFIELTKNVSVMDAFSLFAERAVARELLDNFGPVPHPPKLVKDKFETSAQFAARIEDAQAKYEKMVSKYNGNITKSNQNNNIRKALETAIRSLYGQPVVCDTDYDADSGVISFKIAPEVVAALLGLTGPNTHNTYNFAITKQISTEKAPLFDKKLRNSEAKVFFKLYGNKLILDHAEVMVDDHIYPAVPATETVATTKVVNLGELSSNTIVSPMKLEVSGMDIVPNPTLAIKAAELAKLQMEKADKEKIAVLEKEIAELKSEGLPPVNYSDELLPAPSISEEHSNTIAVIIGNQNYKNADVPAVKYADNDAKAFREYAIKSLGIPAKNIMELHDATKGDLERIFGTADNYKGQLYNYLKAGKSDVLVYYSGHGAPDVSSKGAYIVPSDGDPNYVKMNGYSLDALYRNLNQLPAKSVTVILEACFSGASGGGMLIQQASPLAIAPSDGNIGKINLFTSSSGDQISSWYPDKQHGMFTYFLLKDIKENLQNKKAALNFADLLPEIQEQVDETARQLYNREQTPQFINGSNAKTW
jgi:hypothetical protein